MKHLPWSFACCGFLCALLLCVTGCAPSPAATLPPAGKASTVVGSPSTKQERNPQASGSVAASTGWVYRDLKLGFHLTVPLNWQAQAQPGSQGAPGNEAVTFTRDEPQSRALIVLGIFQGMTMPAAFAARGTPTARIGAYPAFVADRLPGEGRAPCLVRIFLAGDDYVLADWCAPNALENGALFAKILATFQPAPAGFVAGQIHLPVPHTCTTMQRQLGYAQANWGQQLATPAAAGWSQVGSGIFICSNNGSSDWYLFQCTELINRFLYERWALPHLPGNAARYLDYYQNGTLHQGTIHAFPAGSYQLSDDASQGRSSFRPQAGDVLVFQDVTNPGKGWRSGLTNSPGHVALIVGVDSSFVYIAQENYNDSQYFLALPLQHIANGYAIRDRSGWSQRIVRGWIHFKVNGGPAPVN